MSRWIRIQVDMQEHTVFAPEPFTEREAWQWMIGRAAWKETAHRVGATVHKVPVGSFFATIREMQATWKWTSTRRVANFLSLLAHQNMIETVSETGKTLVTVCNYIRYQSGDIEFETAEVAKPKQERNTKDTNTPTTIIEPSLRSGSCPKPDKPSPASPSVIELPSVSGEPVGVTQADVEEWASAFPAVDVPQQLQAIRQWLLANPTRQKTSRGMRRFVVAWLTKRQDQGFPTTANRPQPPPPRKNPMLELIDRDLENHYAGHRDEYPGSPVIEH